MTGLLLETLTERADALDAPTLDPHAIVAAGQRRLMRRRTALAAGCAAVAAAAALVIPHLDRSGSVDDEASDVAAAFAAHEPSYAVDQTIHIDGDTFDVGHRVRALVQTDRGVVFTDPDGDVYAADGEAVDRIGHTDRSRVGQRLVAEGSRVAWLDAPGARFVTVDQASGREETVPAQSLAGEFAAHPLAIDGNVVYAVDARGLFAWDLGSGEVTVADGAEPIGSFFDVKNEVGITRLNRGGTPGHLVSATMSFGDRAIPLVRVLGGQTMVLSPDGSKAAVELDPDAIVVDMGTATSKTLRAPGYAFVAAYQWRDNDSFFALGLAAVDGNLATMPISLLECVADTASCSPVVADAGTYEHLALPFGEPSEN